MKHASTLFLRTIIVLIGIGALAFLLWQPTVEGVNANATSLFEMYFDDPFLAFAYLASIPFFVMLYQAFILLGQPSAKALQTIQRCAIATVVLIVIGVVWLLLGESDDRPPIVAMGTVSSLIFIVIAIAANSFLHSKRFAKT